jgi:hypothetical protein
LSAGALEAPEMRGDMQRFAKVLGSRNYEGLTVKTQVFEGETHFSTVGVAVTRGLRVMFPAS